ncbi:MAG: 50S ribosomal protein L22 [Candidatus Altiarchaeota archaeon]|nr:50S ribosomal protein L22 [Candidatus Altiarchaeota archaeon]
MIANARGWHLSVSHKSSREIATAIRGKPLDDAISFVQSVIKKETPVEMKRFNRKVGHKRGKPGRYPVKAAGEMLKILKNVKANAEYKGMELDKLVISRIEVYRGSHKRPYGARAFCKAPKSRGRKANVSLSVEEMK